jgi:hypothetical protein
MRQAIATVNQLFNFELHWRILNCQRQEGGLQNEHRSELRELGSRNLAR